VCETCTDLMVFCQRESGAIPITPEDLASETAPMGSDE
jgi:hypothetical protein